MFKLSGLYKRIRAPKKKLLRNNYKEQEKQSLGTKRVTKNTRVTFYSTIKKKYKYRIYNL